MDNKKDNIYYFSKVVEDINKIKEYFNNASYEEFIADNATVDARLFRLVQIAENLKMISDDFKSDHQEVGWNGIIGLRNRLVHDYGNTDYSIVYTIVTEDLDLLSDLFEQYLRK